MTYGTPHSSDEREDEEIEGQEDAVETVEAYQAPQSARVTRTMRLGVLFALVLSLGFMGGLSVGATGGSRVLSNVPLIGDGLDAKPDPELDFTDFWKVYNVLESKHVGGTATATPPTSDEKIWSAIQGLVEAYGDPYTTFFPPEEAKIFEENIAGNFSGVGMEIGKNADGILTVIAPLKGTPAERAGIRAGDLIITIDGESTEGLSTDEAVTRIRGEKGTAVRFGILRDGDAVEVSVVRDTIQVPTIDSNYDTSTGVFTITLYEFTGTSAKLFDRALDEFAKSGSDRLLIDVRGNPGGYLSAAVDIASHFLPRGAEVVTEDYQGNRQNVVHRSSGKADVRSGTRVVILIDQGSASASEILAGALQDADVATLVGTRSFGKGSVQELIDIGPASLKVTVARWLTPSGRSISDGGLTPDIVVERTQENSEGGRDVQKERAIQFLRTGQ